MIETSTDFGRSMANMLRVMRGGGRTDRLLNDIEHLAKMTASTKSDFNARSRAKNDLVADLQSWWPSIDDSIDVRDFEFGVCDAALQIVASILESNSTQRCKAMSVLLGHVRERDRRLEQDAITRRNREIDTLVSEAQLRHQKCIAASAANDAAIEAANDNAVSYVYFITDGEAIKIGKANKPRSRLSGLQTSHYKPLVILATIPGGAELERELHVIFEQHRLRGEWFRDCKPIRDFIDRHGAKNGNNALGNAA